MTRMSTETMSLTPLSKLARVIRSKNASPFLVTIDVFFDDEAKYEAVRGSGRLNPDHVASFLRIPVSDILRIQFLDSARGVKISLLKPGHLASGDPEVADVLGCQVYVPLLAMEFPW